MTTETRDLQWPWGLVSREGIIIDANVSFAQAFCASDAGRIPGGRVREPLLSLVRTALSGGRGEGWLADPAAPQRPALHVQCKPLSGHTMALVLADGSEGASGAAAPQLGAMVETQSAHLVDLSERVRHFQGIFDSLPEMACVADHNGHLTEINARMAERLGHPSGAGAPWTLASVSGVKASVVHHRIEAALHGHTETFEGMAHGADGGFFPVEIKLRCLHGAGEDRVVAVIRDIGGVRRAEARHAATEARLRAVLEQPLVGIVIVQHGLVRYANPGMARMFAFDSPDELVERTSALDLVAVEDRERLSEQLAQAENEGGQVRYRFSGRRRDGSTLQVEMHGRGFDYEGRPAVIAVLVDVTERCRLEAELERRASYDPLTGLPNRTLLFDRLDQAIARARRDDAIFAFLFLDLDGFKAVNDRGGHEAGDRVLRIVAERFAGALRASDTLARLGGDEFGVIAGNLTFGDDVVPVAEKLCDALSTPIVVGEQEYRLGVSVGIALFPASAEDSNGLYRAADTAMYQAKQERRGGYAFSAGDGAPLPAVG